MLRSLSVGGVLLVAAALAGCSDSQGFDDLLAQCDLFSNNLFDGGVSRDGIPSLTEPDLAAADQASFLLPDDRVLGVVRNGEARAYPFIVMWWHEMVNDTLGGEPLLVTYCPLTGSGLAFDPRVNGQVHNFGVSGIIFENNLVMFDRDSESLWPQLLTSARCGPLLGTDLARVAIVETTWERWVELHPTTTVVTTNTGFSRDYGTYPYGSYDLPTSELLLFPSSPFNTTRDPKEPVLGVLAGEAAVGYPYFAMLDRGETLAINDALAGRPIVVLWHSASMTAAAFDRRADGQELSFTVSALDPPLFEDDVTGSLWDQTGTAVSGPLAGTALVPLEDAYTVFWFSWSIFHRFARLGIE